MKTPQSSADKKVPTAAAKNQAELYAPIKPTLVKTALVSLTAVLMLWALANLAGWPTWGQTLLIIGGALLIAAATLLHWRSWQVHHQLPSQLRKTTAEVLATPLMPGTLKMRRLHFGGLLTVGAPRKIIIKAHGLPQLDPKAEAALTSALEGLLKTKYSFARKASKPGKKIVLTEHIPEPEKPLTENETIEQRLLHGARELLGESTQAKFHWDTDTEGHDLLVSVEFTGFNGMKMAMPNQQNRIIRQLRTRLPQDVHYKAAMDQDTDTLRMSREKPLPKAVLPPAEQAPVLTNHADYEKCSVPLGVGAGGAQAEWVPVRDAHLLIAGLTGSGKTIALHGVAQRLAQAGWRVWMIDAKEVEFMGYQDWENVELLSQDVDHHIATIYQAWQLMRERYKLIRERQVKIADLEPVVVVIDEITEMMEETSARYQETKGKGPSKNPIEKWLGSLMRRARTAKIHVVMGIQRPDVAFLPGEARSNIGGRLSLSALDPDGAQMVWGNASIGSSAKLAEGKGRGMAKIDGVPTMVQTPWSPNPNPDSPDFHEVMVEAMRPEVGFYERKQIERVDTGDPEVELSWDLLSRASVLDAEGRAIEFDPVGSGSAQQKRKAARDLGVRGEDADRLRTFASMKEAMAEYPTPESPEGGFAPVRLDLGDATGVVLQRWARDVYGTGTAGEAGAAGGFDEAGVVGAGGGSGRWVDLDSVDSAEPVSSLAADQVESGQRIEHVMLGRPITVTEAAASEDGSETVTIAGYDDDGEYVTTELDPDEDVDLMGPAEGEVEQIDAGAGVDEGRS